MFSILRNVIVAAFVLTIVAISIQDFSFDAGTPVVETRPNFEDAREDAEEDTGNDYASQSTWGEIKIAPGHYGQFVLEAEVHGEQIDFLVDTGASVVVVDTETAERLGFDPDELEFTSMARTANGEAPIARIILEEIIIGDLSITSVEAAVVKTSMPRALLGMSFLARLESYEVRDTGLVLRW